MNRKIKFYRLQKKESGFQKITDNKKSYFSSILGKDIQYNDLLVVTEDRYNKIQQYCMDKIISMDDLFDVKEIDESDIKKI